MRAAELERQAQALHTLLQQGLQGCPEAMASFLTQLQQLEPEANRHYARYSTQQLLQIGLSLTSQVGQCKCCDDTHYLNEISVCPPCWQALN